MPTWKAGSKSLADQDQTEDQGERAGQDVRGERPAIRAEEIALPTPQKVGSEVGWEVVGIVRDHTGGDLERQHARHEGQRAAGKWGMVWAHPRATVTRIILGKNRFPTVRDRVAVVFGLHPVPVQLRQEGARLGLVGAEADDRFKLADRLWFLAQGDQDRAEDLVGLGVVGFSAADFAQLRRRLGEVPLPGQG